MILHTSFCTLAVSALCAALALTAPAAQAQTFSNAAAINMPTSTGDGRATLYPSPIVVTGAPASIGYLSVTLRGFSHTFVSDVRVLLVSPTGQKILLMASTNGFGDATNNTLTFIPDGTALLPSSPATVVSGIYACSVYFGLETVSIPAPAPGAPYGTTLAPLLSTNPGGIWNLYAWDNTPSADDGFFAGGWSISFNETPSLPVTTAFTYQGTLRGAGGLPITGDANVRFTLCDNGTAPVGIAGVAPAITRNLTGITDGLITTALDFGSIIDTSQALWLNIEVESPPGSGFVTLTPRQPITPTPQARVAQFAATATTATTAITATSATTATTATTAITANQLAPGRARIRGDAGAAINSPGIWFASPIIAPVDRAFVGQLDNNNVGFFNGSWNFLVNANGNTVLGDSSGTAPSLRLTVNGSIQLNTGITTAPNRLVFGVLGNQLNTAENSDAVYFQRVNGSVNNTDLRLYVGDDASLAPGAGGDAFSIWSTNGSVLGGTETFRFQMNGVALKPGGGSWTALSDPRAKHDILPLAGTLDKLLNLRGYSFLYNDDRVASGFALPGAQIGLMADEVANVFPDWVSTDSSGTRYVTERATTALMVEALRDLRAEKDLQIQTLKAEAARRDADAARRDAESIIKQREVDDLKARLAAIEAALSKLTNTK